jgi:hypothetical protein
LHESETPRIQPQPLSTFELPRLERAGKRPNLS